MLSSANEAQHTRRLEEGVLFEKCRIMKVSCQVRLQAELRWNWNHKLAIITYNYLCNSTSYLLLKTQAVPDQRQFICNLSWSVKDPHKIQVRFIRSSKRVYSLITGKTAIFVLLSDNFVHVPAVTCSFPKVHGIYARHSYRALGAFAT